MAAPMATMTTDSATTTPPVKGASKQSPQRNSDFDSAKDTYTFSSKARPRGKLAARMLAAKSTDGEVPQADIDAFSESERALDEYTRVHEPSQSMDEEESPEEMDMEDSKASRERRRTRIIFSDEEDEEEENDAEVQGTTARERMIRLLAMEQKPAQEKQAEIQSTASDDDEDVPVLSRKRHRMMQRDSPKSSPARPSQFNRDSLFVSPGSNRAHSPARADSDEDDLPAAPTANARFMALVEKKRQERLAKEKEALEEKKKAAEARAKTTAQHEALLENDDYSGSDEEGGRRLTQQVRPTRKASKKALEEMHRETQRMSRNMQLAHQAKTKKKITKSSLFARFNYKPEGFVEEEPADSSSPRRSDVEMHDTPPTSPMSPSITAQKAMSAQVESVELPIQQNPRSEDEAELPSLQDVLSSQRIASSPSKRKLDKGKEKAVQQSHSPEKASSPKQKIIRVHPPKFSTQASAANDDSDDDLEIIASKTPIKSKKDLHSIFDRIPAQKAQESAGIHALRLLAHISSPTKQTNNKNAKPSMTASELQMSLQQRARQQATREREERLQALRDRGIIVQTAEERAKEYAEVEDFVAKAREEALQLAKKEKAAAKKERKANGEVDPLDMDSSDDEEWQEEMEQFSQQMSPSGSEDEGDDEQETSDEEDDQAEDAEMEDAVGTVNPLVDNEASESETQEDDEDMPDDDAGDFINDDEEEMPNAVSRRRTKNINVISDDEDDVSILQSPQPLPTLTPASHKTSITSPQAPMSVLRSATKTFIPGITVAGPAGLGLTQIFAGTMDTQPDYEGTPMDSPSQLFDSQQDSLAFLRKLPPPTFPEFAPTMDDDSQDVIKSSQMQIDNISATQPTQAETQGMQLHFSQSQIHGFDSLVDSSTQYSELPEPTQDEGFKFMSPIMGRFSVPPHSTVDTMIAGTPTPGPAATPSIIADSPIMKRKGKLRRRIQAPVFSDDEAEPANADFEITPNVFDTMRKASRAKKPAATSDFDKKKSAAKEMVQEQASESEDEYAGLGGASDDDSNDEEDAILNAMIDDQNIEDFDERKLAAFYADRERAADEQQVNKLFKDITSGLLRRKRGADYNLSDSDDDGEARRRMKRREFAKMRKALLEDERIGKIAENPKRAAFLRAIEDRGEDEEMDFLDDEVVDAEHATNSQAPAEDSQEVTNVPNSQPDGAIKRKATTEAAPRLPPHLRRTKAGADAASKRPSSLAEIRASLSSLIDDANAMHKAVAEESDSELEIETADAGEKGDGKGKENHDPFARRPSNVAVVDRISLQRNNSASLSARMAFAPASAMAAGFKVPPLLRRATTNSSSENAGMGGKGEGVKMAMGGEKGKTAKRGVRFFTREEERKRGVEEGERRREEKLLKRMEGRRKEVGGLFGRGSFA